MSFTLDDDVEHPSASSFNNPVRFLLFFPSPLLLAPAISSLSFSFGEDADVGTVSLSGSYSSCISEARAVDIFTIKFLGDPQH